MNTAYLLTGGNMGKRAYNLLQARDLIGAACGKIIHASPLYETAAWGNTDQEPFLNQALMLATRISPPELLEKLLDIENVIGRIREEKYGPRIIDIDILLYDGFIVNKPMLTIPHPELQHRRFALTPLSAIAPDLMHPVLHRPIKKLLAECTDPLPVREWTERS